MFSGQRDGEIGWFRNIFCNVGRVGEEKQFKTGLIRSVFVPLCFLLDAEFTTQLSCASSEGALVSC